MKSNFASHTMAWVKSLCHKLYTLEQQEKGQTSHLFRTECFHAHWYGNKHDICNRNIFLFSVRRRNIKWFGMVPGTKHHGNTCLSGWFEVYLQASKDDERKRCFNWIIIFRFDLPHAPCLQPDCGQKMHNNSNQRRNTRNRLERAAVLSTVANPMLSRIDLEIEFPLWFTFNAHCARCFIEMPPHRIWCNRIKNTFLSNSKFLSRCWFCRTFFRTECYLTSKQFTQVSNLPKLFDKFGAQNSKQIGKKNCTLENC